jgi:hypothetical protein
MFFVAMLPVLAGCLVETTIDATGAGTMTLTYRLATEAQFEPSKKRFQSADVTLVSASVTKEKYATYNLKFNDVTKISTVQHFQNAVFTLKDNGDGTKTFGVRFKNKNPSRLPDEMVAYLGAEVKFVLNTPGEITASNAAEKSGSKAVWAMPDIALDATFKAPASAAGAPATGAQQPTPAAAAGSTPATGK